MTTQVESFHHMVQPATSGEPEHNFTVDSLEEELPCSFLSPKVGLNPSILVLGHVKDAARMRQVFEKDCEWLKYMKDPQIRIGFGEEKEGRAMAQELRSICLKQHLPVSLHPEDLWVNNVKIVILFQDRTAKGHAGWQQASQGGIPIVVHMI